MGTEEVGTVNVHLVEHLGNMRSMKIYFTVVSFQPNFLFEKMVYSYGIVRNKTEILCILYPIPPTKSSLKPVVSQSTITTRILTWSGYRTLSSQGWLLLPHLINSYTASPASHQSVIHLYKFVISKYVNNIIQYEIFWNCFLFTQYNSVEIYQVVRYINSSLFFITDQYSLI